MKRADEEGTNMVVTITLIWLLMSTHSQSSICVPSSVLTVCWLSDSHLFSTMTFVLSVCSAFRHRSPSNCPIMPGVPSSTYVPKTMTVQIMDHSIHRVKPIMPHRIKCFLSEDRYHVFIDFCICPHSVGLRQRLWLDSLDRNPRASRRLAWVIQN